MDQIALAIAQAALQQQQMYNFSAAEALHLPSIAMPHLGAVFGYPPVNQLYSNDVNQQNQEDSDDDDENLRTIFCANLDERVNEEILYEVFLQAGPIENARIPKDNSGRQRNFGFITYVHACAVPYALDLYQGLELFQKKVIIKHQGAERSQQQQQHRQHPDQNFTGHSGKARPQNPFTQDQTLGAHHANAPSRHGRHNLHDSKPYDRKHNNDHRLRPHQQQHQNFNMSNRRSEQRHSGRRRL